jgi:hypothetical protein
MTKIMRTKSLLPLLIAWNVFFAAFDSALAQTWIKTLAPNKNWAGVVSSADGNKLVAVANGGGVYISASTGMFWEFFIGQDKGLILQSGRRYRS